MTPYFIRTIFMYKRLNLVFVLGLSFLILGCWKRQPEQTNKQIIRVVGVNQFAPHPILDAVYAGLSKRLSSETNISVIVKNANGDRVLCHQINEHFVQEGVSVIVALGTPAAQSAVALSKARIPVVFGAITDPVGAKLAESLEKPGGNKTGSTNRWPFRKQVELVRKIHPTAKTIGVVVNPSEANCEAGMIVIREAAKELGFKLIEVPISASSEVTTAVESLKGRADVMLISPSNDVYTALDALLGAALRIGLPVVGGDETAVKRGSLATYGFSNEDVGIATAECVLSIFRGDRPAGEIPVATPPAPKLFLNREKLTANGLVLPPDLEK